MIINLGISPNFRFIDFEHLTFPTVMSVDYVRVYQNPDNINTGCDPEDFPTQTYINKWVLLFFVCSFVSDQVLPCVRGPGLDNMGE